MELKLAVLHKYHPESMADRSIGQPKQIVEFNVHGRSRSEGIGFADT